MSESAPPPVPPVAVVLLAGGRGTRAGFGRPKQLASLGRKPMLQWSLDAFAGHPAISGGVLVANDDVLAAFGPLPEHRYRFVSVSRVSLLFLFFFLRFFS